MGGAFQGAKNVAQCYYVFFSLPPGPARQAVTVARGEAAFRPSVRHLRVSDGPPRRAAGVAQPRGDGNESLESLSPSRAPPEKPLLLPQNV